MPNEKVFVTRRIPQAGLDMLASRAELVVSPHDRALTKAEIMEGVADADGLVCLLSDVIDAEVMSAAPRLRGISNYAVGFNNIDIPEATRRRVAVSNTPGVLTETTADLAWALIMSTARRVVESDRFTREGRFGGWAPMLFLGADVYGKTLGVVGYGRIGSAVARRARGFDMRVLYHSRTRLSEEQERAQGIVYASMDELLRESDFVSLHMPLLPETRHMIGEEQLKMMKPTAILINTARGPVVDEAALVRALNDGIIAGAGLDVYEDEPQLAPGLAQCANAVVLPHIGSASLDTRTKMSTMVACDMIDILDGKIPKNIVNPLIGTEMGRA